MFITELYEETSRRAKHSPRAPSSAGAVASGGFRGTRTLCEVQVGAWLFPVFSKAIILRHVTEQSKVFGHLSLSTSPCGLVRQYEKDWVGLESR